MSFFTEYEPSDPDNPTPVDEFFGKIDWEGGYGQACDYGLRAEDYDLPKDMVDDWNEVRAAYDEFEQLASDFEAQWVS